MYRSDNYETNAIFIDEEELQTSIEAEDFLLENHQLRTCRIDNSCPREKEVELARWLDGRDSNGNSRAALLSKRMECRGFTLHKVTPIDSPKLPQDEFAFFLVGNGRTYRPHWADTSLYMTYLRKSQKEVKQNSDDLKVVYMALMMVTLELLYTRNERMLGDLNDQHAYFTETQLVDRYKEYLDHVETDVDPGEGSYLRILLRAQASANNAGRVKNFLKFLTDSKVLRYEPKTQKYYQTLYSMIALKMTAPYFAQLGVDVDKPDFSGKHKTSVIEEAFSRPIPAGGQYLF